MAGLDPAIHVFAASRAREGMDARQVGCFRLGNNDLTEVGNTRLRLTSAGMTAGSVVRFERKMLFIDGWRKRHEAVGPFNTPRERQRGSQVAPHALDAGTAGSCGACRYVRREC